MAAIASPGIETLVLHAGGRLDAGDCAAVALLEQRIAALQGGVGAVATTHLSAAAWLAVATLASAGAHLVVADDMRDDLRPLLQHALPRLGIASTFVAAGDPAAAAAAIRPQTRLLWVEALPLQSLQAADLTGWSALARAHGVPLLVDASATLPGAVAQADLLLLDGAGPLGAGAGALLVDSGNFHWDRSRRHPELTEPDPVQHGRVYSEESCVGAWLARARDQGLRDFGGAMAPPVARRWLQALDSAPARWAQQQASTRRLLDDLAEAATAPDADRGLPAVRGAALGPFIGLAWPDAPLRLQAFTAALRWFQPGAAAGGVLSSWQRLGPTGVRLSVGLESLHDLRDDLARGLRAALKTVPEAAPPARETAG